jgi:hypothetical protein
MSQPLACELNDTRELAPDIAAGVFDRAVAEHSVVRLLVPAGPVERLVTGVLIGRRGPWLLIRLNDPAESSALADGLRIQGTLETDDIPYLFETRCDAPADPGEQGSIRLPLPNTLQAIERRQSTRKLLHQPTEVTLRNVNGATAFSLRAAMLNVSAEGLACRVSTADATRLSRGLHVWARFRVGDDPEPFEMICRITNETRGGTPDTVVLGMAFVEEENPPLSHARIWSALKNAE